MVPRDTADLHAFGAGSGVALGGADDGGGAGVFFETDVELGKRSVAAGEDYFVEVGLEEAGTAWVSGSPKRQLNSSMEVPVGVSLV